MNYDPHLAILCPGPDPFTMIYLLAQFVVFAALPLIGVCFTAAVVKLLREGSKK